MLQLKRKGNHFSTSNQSTNAHKPLLLTGLQDVGRPSTPDLSQKRRNENRECDGKGNMRSYRVKEPMVALQKLLCCQWNCERQQKFFALRSSFAGDNTRYIMLLKFIPDISLQSGETVDQREKSQRRRVFVSDQIWRVEQYVACVQAYTNRREIFSSMFGG